MRCCVTGGCGFIGSHVVDALVAAGHEVKVVDDLSTGDRANLNPQATFVEASITDYNVVERAFEGVDWVFHPAAWARVVRSVEDPIGTHDVNVNGTLNVFQAAQVCGVKRVIYSSSSSVNGDQDTHVMTEDMSTKPKSPYALHKLIGEQYATMFAQIYEMDIVSLRYFNVYGPRQLVEGAYALVIGKFLRQKSQGEPMTIYGDGEQTRAYTYVADVVRANLLAADAELEPNRNTVLNIGTNQETSVNEVAAKIGGEVRHILPNPRGELEELRKVADFSKAKRVIGWEPRIDFDEGMRLVLEDFARTRGSALRTG